MSLATALSRSTACSVGAHTHRILFFRSHVLRAACPFSSSLLNLSFSDALTYPLLSLPASAERVGKDGQKETPQLAHVALPNQEAVPVVARVCLDTQGEGRLNAASVVFEGSRETSNGERVEVCGTSQLFFLHALFIQ